jgi:uncharacterized protein (TIGR02594 family)
MQFARYIFLIFTIGLLASSCTISLQNKNISIADHNTPSHIIYALKYLNYNEKTNKTQLHQLLGIDPTRIEWCAAFINSVLKENNITGSKSLTARSFLKWGEKTNNPQIGDILVFVRGDSEWQGHAGFYLDTVKYSNKTYYMILGGNQNDKVSIIYYPKSLLLEARKIPSETEGIS